MTVKAALESAAAKLMLERRLPRVLYYHSVHPSAALSHRPGTLDDQLRLLRDQGYDFVTFAEAVMKLGQLAPRTVAITFDDGYADNLTYALPILANRGATATVFMVSGMLGQTSDNGNRLYTGRAMLSASQLRELHAAGIEIGSHTRSHAHLRRTWAIAPTLVHDELSGSRKELEDVLGAPVTSFAYPNGQRGTFSNDTRRAIAEAGYRSACTTMWGALTPRCDRLEIPRVEVRFGDSLEVFADKLAGRYDFMIPYCHLTDRSRLW